MSTIKCVDYSLFKNFAQKNKILQPLFKVIHVHAVGMEIKDLLDRTVSFGYHQWCTQKFFSGGGSTNSVEDRENGDLGGSSHLVRGSGGSCNLVQEI